MGIRLDRWLDDMGRHIVEHGWADPWCSVAPIIDPRRERRDAFDRDDRDGNLGDGNVVEVPVAEGNVVDGNVTPPAVPAGRGN